MPPNTWVVGAEDKDGGADRMNSHTDVEMPLSGLPDEEVVTIELAPPRSVRPTINHGGVLAGRSLLGVVVRY